MTKYDHSTTAYASRLCSKFKLVMGEALVLVAIGLDIPEKVKGASDKTLREAIGENGLKKVRSVWPVKADAKGAVVGESKEEKE